MRVGEPVSVVVDSQRGRVFRGHIESLSPASGAQFALIPPDNATGNFTRIVQRIPIRITIPVGQPGLGELRPGMSARVRRGEAGAAQFAYLNR
jgi:membrane fusion protein (multidrug efflux system)